LRVFISCPEDVRDEKEIVEKVCHELTKTLLPLEGIEIIPIRWPNDVVSQITGEGTQAVINEQVRRYDPDVYIGIMWTRFGDKRPNGLTPTQEEFDIAFNNYRNNRKPFIQFYFKLDEFSPQDVYQEQQYAAVKRFRDRIKGSDLGAYKEFKGRQQFEDQIHKSLIYIVKNFDSLTAPETDVAKIKYSEVKPYLARRVCSTKDYVSGRLPYLTDKYAKDTLDTIPDCKRIVLLSDAGVGKTTELRRIASHFSRDDTPFHPFLVMLNKYVNQSVAELLPQQWKAVPDSKRIIILDGLDEIESKNKNDAIRQIELFAEQNPKTHIVVSSRTNFYELETEQLSGTLKGFSSYVLLELTQKEIDYYVKEALEQKAKDFHEAIVSNRIYELLNTPFYLTRLVALFHKNHALPRHKAGIFEQLLRDRMQLDVEHFRTTKKELRPKEKTIIQALERLALGMEMLGRNYITDGEYGQIVENESLRELLEHCTVWKKDQTETVKWQFEHNNFQEYLAAKLLSNKPFATIRELMFFRPNYRKLIPSWSNTLSFLITISDDDTLIQWVMDNEPEVAVKFEPDRIETSSRIQIFKNIFNHYKKKQICINHEKFRYDELARFGQSDEIVEFVLREAEKAEHYTTLSNAIELLSYLQIPHGQRDRTCNVLVNYALSNDFGDQVQSRALMALADLKPNSPDVSNQIAEALRTSDSEWIRYGLYYFLHNSDNLDDNIDIFLDGLRYVKFDPSSERGRLFDEHLHLRIGLEKAKSPGALVKILTYLKEHPQDFGEVLFEESIPVIAENAAKAYSEQASLFQAAKQLFEAFIDNLLEQQASQLAVFFDKTETRLQLFQEYLSRDEDRITRWIVLALLADNPCIELFVQQYEANKLEDDDVLSFRSYLYAKNPDLYLLFNDLINQRTANKFPLPEQRDYEKETRGRAQRDINLLFDKQAFLSQIQLIFDTEDKKSLTHREILDIQGSNWNNPYFSMLAINQLRKLAKQQLVTFDSVSKTVNTWDWDWFCICNIYDRLNHNEDIILTQAQRGWIADWCYSNLNRINFRTALVTRSRESRSSRSIAVFLWYFLRKLNLQYPQPVLLDLLSYDWAEGGQYVGIEYLEPLLSAHEMTTTVLKNLERGIQNDDVLKNHLGYCKRHKVTEVLPYASSELASMNRGEDVRRVALETISQLSETATVDLENALPQIKDDFKWNVIEELVRKNSQACHKYLLSTLQTANEEEKMKAAKYLIRLEDLEGLKYYVTWVRRHNKAPETTHFDKSPLVELRVLEAVPYLIELLEESYQPDFDKTRFDYLQHYVLETLGTIALQSDQNYQTVKKAVEDFIDRNTSEIENVNFLNVFIERIAQKYYAAKSEKLNIDDVVTKLQSILDS